MPSHWPDNGDLQGVRAGGAEAGRRSRSAAGRATSSSNSSRDCGRGADPPSGWESPRPPPPTNSSTTPRTRVRLAPARGVCCGGVMAAAGTSHVSPGGRLRERWCQLPRPAVGRTPNAAQWKAVELAPSADEQLLILAGHHPRIEILGVAPSPPIESDEIILRLTSSCPSGSPSLHPAGRQGTPVS